MKPGLWEQTPYAFVLLPRALNMIRPTEIEVFSSPLLTQIHSINEICNSHDVICVQEALREEFEFRVGRAHIASHEN